MSDMETAEAIYDNFGTEQSPLEDVVAIANAIADAREEGRAAGYAEAIEKAANTAFALMKKLNTDYRVEIEASILALAPAKEEP